MKFLHSDIANKRVDLITKAEVEGAVDDIARDPRVRQISIAGFDADQRRWMLNIDLVDGISGRLNGVYSIGRVYGDLRDTNEGWKQGKGKAHEERIARDKRHDDAIEAACALLFDAGFHSGDVAKAADHVWGGHDLTAESHVARALDFHNEVISIQFARHGARRNRGEFYYTWRDNGRGDRVLSRRPERVWSCVA